MPIFVISILKKVKILITRIICLFFAFTLLSVIQLFSSETAISSDTLEASYLSESEDTIIVNDTIDPSLLTQNTPLFIDESEFFYADNKRFSLNGNLPYRDTQLEPITTSIVCGTWAGIFAFQHILQLNSIWKEQGEFRIIEDGRYALYSDKAGHIFGTYFSAYLVRETMMLSGFSWDLSAVIGTCVGLAYTTYVEVLDGYGVNWGFSPSDFYADIAGAAFFIGQHYIPFLQNFTPKFQYYPAPWFKSNHRNPHDAFIDDYSSHTLWLSVNVHNLLPKDLKSYFPSWLELSFGYAARNLCTPEFGCQGTVAKPHLDDAGNIFLYGDPKYILSLDVNLVKLLPDGCNAWNWFKQTLNMIKMPTPAIEFGSETKFYLIYPFPIELGKFRL